MNLLSALPYVTKRLRNPRQVVSDDWSDRKVIRNTDTNLFCWKRPENSVVTDYLGQLIKKKLEPISFFASQEDLKESISEFRTIWDQKGSPDGDLFWEDIYLLSNDFLSLSETKSGTIVLKVISNDACTKFHTDGYSVQASFEITLRTIDACTKFHTDGYSLRLFTTYFGRGTEWLPEKATNRRGLGKSNELIVKDVSQVQQMDTFEVGILKGELPNMPNPTYGIVHRSPEISKLGEKRIILRVDI